MFVLITGGGRTGTKLANLLMTQKHQVRLIEHRPSVISRLHRDLPTEVIFEGNATDPAILERAGIRQAQILAACSADDEINLVTCYLARKRFNIPRTIARVNDPSNTWLFDEKFHVDVALSNADIMASLIEEEMSLGDMMTLLKLRRGEYSLVEEKIPPGAPGVGQALKDLGLPESCVIAAIIRNGKVHVPRGMTVFQVGDEVLAITGRDGLEELRKLFGSES
jgi:trk system potassium uptake protein TrkA